jgi:DNA modification methylase
MNLIEFGDCRETMRRWAADGVKAQMCVTSPPYFGLRDYGHEGQIGLEETPQQYIEAMVEVFRCVRDVLADDGTVWLNIGDSYAANRSYQVPSTKGGPKHSDGQSVGGKGSAVPNGMKPKDLIGIPWRVAFALQEAGWYLRQDIIWHKPNPMPESVTDRCTKAHEYIFLLSKSERYYFDAEAMKEPSVEMSRPQSEKRRAQRMNRGVVVAGKFGQTSKGVDGGAPVTHVMKSGTRRNRRSVWTVATRPYKGAHFATFPPALIEPCILAGSRLGDIVLDPFMGSGTTAQVAQDLGRQYIGCELNPAYKALQDRRTQQQSLVLA